MSYLNDFLCEPKNKFEEGQKRRATEYITNFESQTIVTDGVVRWKKSNNIPPDEILELWNYANLDFDIDETVRVRKIENAIFFENYRKAQENRVYSDEELFEMRCAFGEGAVIVDAISGNKIQL